MDEANYRNNLTKKTMLMMERRNRTLEFVSRKRMIFIMWRHVVKQERAFIFSVVNTINKSLQMKGFHYIKNTHQDFKYHDKVSRAMRMFCNRIQRRHTLDAFNLVKAQALSKVAQTYFERENQKDEENDAFLQHVDMIKETNNQRCSEFFLQRNKANVFKAWVNMTKHWKLVKSKEREFLTRQTLRKRRLAVVMWKQRVECTKHARSQKALLNNKFDRMLMRATFLGLKG